MATSTVEIGSTLVHDVGVLGSPPELNAPQHDEQGNQSTKRKRGRHQRELWSFTREAHGSEPARDKFYHEILYCGRCSRFHTTSTVRFQSHLEKEHRIRVALRKSDARVAQEQTLHDIFGRQHARQQGRDLAQEEHLKSAIQPAEFKEALARLITNRNLPHSLTTFPEFRACILAVNYCSEELVQLSRNTVPKLIEDTFILHQAALQKKLSHALSWIHFSIDMWTAPSRTGYQAIVASFVDEDTRDRATALLSLREFKGTHGGEAQAQKFLEIIDEYNIEPSQVGFFVMDNAESNDSMLRHLALHILGFDPVQRRVRCHGHILNLAAQAFLFGPKKSGKRGDEDEAVELALLQTSGLSQAEIEGRKDPAAAAREWRQFGALGKLHNLVVWFRSSTERYQNFIRVVGKAIPLDNDTRWNSWFDEIDVALEKRKEIMSWTDDHYHVLSKDALSFEDWEELEQIHSFLSLFQQITKATEGDSSTLDEMLSSMDFLVIQYKEAQLRYKGNPRMTARILASWFKFDKYYRLTDSSPVYVAAILLHPSLRQTYLQEQWEHQKQYIVPAIDSVRSMWSLHFKAPVPPCAGLPSRGSPTNPLADWKGKIYGCRSVEEEFEHFISQPPTPIAEQRALQWWLESAQAAIYPNLRRMALNIFAIPAMSASAERVFSGARRTISWERSKLGGPMVEMTECIKSWTRAQSNGRASLLTGTFRAGQEGQDNILREVTEGRVPGECESISGEEPCC
jgi:hypothetical protein